MNADLTKCKIKIEITDEFGTTRSLETPMPDSTLHSVFSAIRSGLVDIYQEESVDNYLPVIDFFYKYP